MRYIYNPVTDQLDDVETPNLGEKYFASAETDEIIRQINEKHGPGTLFPASDMPVPEDPYRDFMERNKRAELPLDNFNTPDLEQSEFLRPGETLADWDTSFVRPNAEGGRIRQNFNVAGLVGKYAITPAVATTLGAFGVTAASIAKLAEENPTALNKIMAYIGSIPGKLEESDQKTKELFKDYISAFVVGVHGPKSKEMEDLEKAGQIETFPIQETESWIESYPDAKPEKIKAPDNIPPQIKTETEGFPIPEQKTWKDYVLYKKTLGPGHGGAMTTGKKKATQFTKKQKNAPLPEEVEVLDKIELKNWIRKTAKEPGAADNIDLYKAYIKYAKEHGLGSYKAVDKDFKDIFKVASISGLARARGFPLKIKKTEWIGFNKNALTLTEIANKLKKDPNFLDKRLEGVDLNKLYTQAEIISFLGARGKEDQSNLANLIKIKEIGKPGGFITNKPVRIKKIGNKEIFHFEDILKNLKANAKAKIILGEGKFTEQTAERARVNKLLDKDLYKFVEDIRGVLRSRAQGDDVLYEAIYDPGGKMGEESARLTTDLGHLIPLEWLKKDSKVKFATQIKDQLYGLNDLVDQHPVVNQRILRKQQGEITTLGMDIDKFLKKYKGKKWNAESIEEAEKINGRLDTILDKYTKQIQTLSKGDLKLGNTIVKHDPTVAGQEGTLSGPKLNIRPGGEIKITDVIIDKSRINPEFILGKIDLINPKAIKMSDLSKSEKELYKQAIIDQKMENLFPLLREAGFTLDDIKTFEEELLYGYGGEREGKGFLGEEGEVRKFKKYKKRTFENSGGIIPDQDILKYADGGRVSFADGSPNPHKPEGDDFLNELMFKFDNIDDVTIDDTPATYDDSKSKLAQVADLFDPRNIPYYGQMAGQAALRVGEFGARILPATGELISDLIQKPLFKTPSIYEKDDMNNMVDDMEVPENKARFVGGPIFRNFLENITPTSTEKLVGLDTMINEQKKKMIERGSSSLPVKVAETAALGAELIAPIFPGIKILRAYANAKGLKANKETGKLLEQEIDQMAAAKGMTRREFLVATGAVGTLGLAKLLGISGELPKITKTAEAVTSVAKTVDGVPEYLYDLMRVIRIRGTQKPSSSAFLDRQEVFEYKGITLYHDVTSLGGDVGGSFRIVKTFDTPSSHPEIDPVSYNKVELEVRKGEIVVKDEGLETQKAVHSADEFEEATSYPAREGGEDIDFYVDDDYHKQLEKIADEMQEIDMIEEMKVLP